MSRYTGETGVIDVLEAAGEWKTKCFINNGSLFSDENLWSKENLLELRKLLIDNPIDDPSRDFIDKFKEQLSSSSKEIIKLGAEVFWFYLLFPHNRAYGAEKKSSQIREIWSWSGDSIPNENFLDPRYLSGVGASGTAYMTRRPDQILFFLDLMCDWKNLNAEERTSLMEENTPWNFMKWVDDHPNSHKKPIRNTFLYFVFPDQLERINSNEHRQLIITAFKSKLPSTYTFSSDLNNGTERDKIIAEIRNILEVQFGTKDLDFYVSPIQELWSTTSMQQARKKVANAITEAIEPYGLELRQCGSKKNKLTDCKETDASTGFWKHPADATNKPLRWIIHIDLTSMPYTAKLAENNGAQLIGNRKIAFSNNAQEKSGAITVRIIPAFKIGINNYTFHEEWEWLMLLCFYPALPKGSSGQLLDDFDPSTGKLTYMSNEQSYIFSALIKLNVEDSQFNFTSNGNKGQITYEEATKLVSQFINTNDSVSEELEVTNGN